MIDKDQIKENNEEIKESSEPSESDEGDDFFAKLDQMRGITDEQLQDKLPKDSSEEIEERVTKAFQTLSDTDQEVMSRTKMIHIDPNIPIETQMMKTITLQKQTEDKHKKVMKTIIGFMIAGIVISVIGLLTSRFLNTKPSETATPTVQPNAVPTTADEIKINETLFPDAVFREYVQSQADTDGNGSLSPAERNAFLIVSIQSNPKLTNVIGIEYFPLLQAINISNCPVKEIDVSKLVEIESLNISSTGITSLDLINNVQLTALNVSNTNITSLEIPSEIALTDVKTDNSDIVCTKDNQNIAHSCEVSIN